MQLPCWCFRPWWRTVTTVFKLGHNSLLPATPEREIWPSSTVAFSVQSLQPHSQWNLRWMENHDPEQLKGPSISCYSDAAVRPHWAACLGSLQFAILVSEYANSNHGEDGLILEIAQNRMMAMDWDRNIFPANLAVKMAGFIGRASWPSDEKMPSSSAPLHFFMRNVFFDRNIVKLLLLSDSSPLVSVISGACWRLCDGLWRIWSSISFSSVNLTISLYTSNELAQSNLNEKA